MSGHDSGDRWGRTLCELIGYHPVTALMRGVSPADVPDLVPEDWRTGREPAVDQPDESGPAADLLRLLESPRRLFQLVRSRLLQAASAAPRQLLRSWHRDLTALSELFAATGSPLQDAFTALLARSAGRYWPAGGTTGRPAAGTTGAMIEAVIRRLEDHLPQPCGQTRDRPRYSVAEALSVVCGHRAEAAGVTAMISMEIERWCDPGWRPAPPPAASHAAWSVVAAELAEVLRRGTPPTVAEATARFTAACALAHPVLACQVPRPWVGQVTDAAYQSLGRIPAGGGHAGAGAVLSPPYDPPLVLTPRRLAYLLLIMCHELDPGHGVQLDALAGCGAQGAVLAISRPPAWFEGAGVVAESAALDLLPDPEVEWQVRFHRLRRLVSSAMLLRLHGQRTQSWVRSQLERLGSGYLEPVMAGLSIDLTSLVYAYGAGVMEASPPGSGPPAGVAGRHLP